MYLKESINDNLLLSEYAWCQYSWLLTLISELWPLEPWSLTLILPPLPFFIQCHSRFWVAFFFIKCLTSENLQLWCSLTVHPRSLQSYSTLCNPLDWSLLGSSVYGTLQAKILEWVAMPFSRGSSRPGVQTCGSCIGGRFFTTKPPWKPSLTLNQIQNSEEADLKTELLFPTFSE